jgi:hypothetical protein
MYRGSVCGDHLDAERLVGGSAGSRARSRGLCFGPGQERVAGPVRASAWCRSCSTVSVGVHGCWPSPCMGRDHGGLPDACAAERKPLAQQSRTGAALAARVTPRGRRAGAASGAVRDGARGAGAGHARLGLRRVRRRVRAGRHRAPAPARRGSPPRPRPPRWTTYNTLAAPALEKT